ncbi:hypothetical protein HNY73_005789 [Argiope bruennichi]|uniref:Uncharacterized protein n=1 Tax=Argiope bruennichi TaxID=94029 RepID=A0A8T0FMP7_ARGBR|nr:hypothetical protein HNY73_005789 [Argiope bruennichi]
MPLFMRDPDKKLSQDRRHECDDGKLKEFVRNAKLYTTGGSSVHSVSLNQIQLHRLPLFMRDPDKKDIQTEGMIVMMANGRSLFLTLHSLQQQQHNQIKDIQTEGMIVMMANGRSLFLTLHCIQQQQHTRKSSLERRMVV